MPVQQWAKNNQQYNELADRIHSGLDGDVTVYQGFFYPQAEYYLTFDIIRKAGGAE